MPPRKRLTISDRLRIRREMKGLSRKQVADAAGMHPLRLWRIEMGKQRPLAEDVEAIAGVLDTSVASLYGSEAA